MSASRASATDSPLPAGARVYVGTCGFSYKDWIGPFYPIGIKPIDMLAYYARSFEAVEIDSTYYATPARTLFEGMDRRTPPRFRFTVKTPGSITHAPGEIDVGAEDELAREAAAFLACLEPIVASGKLGAVLAQFPNAFRPGSDASRRLETLRRFWPDLPLVAEFRHREWQRQAALDSLRELDIGWCNVDEPRFASLMRPGAEVTSAVGYIRLHGRNAAQWWKPDTPDRSRPTDARDQSLSSRARSGSRSSGARYDYLYNDAELSEWVPRIGDVAADARETYVFFNNHRLGKAARNANDMSRLLGLRFEARPEPELRLF